MIRLSLIIPTYNRAAQLITALESIVVQDAPAAAWECVVVNNNSPDDTPARFAAFAARHSELNLRMVTEGQPGVSCARNRGIAEARGEYMAFIDDDERVNPGFISAYIAFFDAYPEAIVAGGRIIAEYVTGRPDWMSKYAELPIANPLDLGASVRTFPAGRVPGSGNMGLRRGATDRVGSFDPELGRVNGRLIGGEENDLFERFLRAGYPCWYVPDAVMWHIIPPEKLTVDYFRRLCYNVGVSQRMRAVKNNRYPRTVILEGMKWVATLLLAFTMSPRQWRWLVRMRVRISRGVLGCAE